MDRTNKDRRNGSSAVKTARDAEALEQYAQAKLEHYGVEVKLNVVSF